MNDAVITKIEEIRKDNNSLWMKLLRIAMEKDPDATKALLVKIRKNDSQIVGLFGLLANDHQ